MRWSRAALTALATVGLASLGMLGSCSSLVILFPLAGQLSLVGNLRVEISLPSAGDPATLVVTLDDVVVHRVPDLPTLAVAGAVASGEIPVPAAGWHTLEAHMDSPSGAVTRSRRFQTVALDRPDICEILNQAECLLPYPSSRFQIADPSTVTGVRQSLPAAGLPAPAGPPLVTTPYDELDGYSPMAQILMHFPGPGVDLAASNAARLLEPGCCGQPPGPPWIDTRTFDGRSLDPDSPTLLIDAETGELVLHFVELDARANGNPARQALILRPAQSLLPNRRYIVAVRNLVDTAGAPIEPEPVFAAILEARPSDIAAVEEKRAHLWDHVLPVVFGSDAELDADDRLLLAFDFTTQSESQLTGQMLSMRDQAFAWLADREAELSPGDPGSETFTVDNVEGFDCSQPGTVLGRVVRGTFQSPLFLDGDLAANGVQFMNVDENDVPVMNGVTHPEYSIGIPCTLFEDPPPEEPTRALVLGHGLFMRGRDMVTLAPLLSAVADVDFDYVIGATDWRGLSSQDVAWLGGQIIGLGANRFNNFPAFPDRLRQGMLNTLVLARMMKRGFFNNNPSFQIDGRGVFPGPSEEMFYWGISLGGIHGTWFASLTPDVQRFGLDVPAVNFSLLLQRATPFAPFEVLLSALNLTDPMQVLLGLGLFHDLWVAAEPAGYVRHVTSDPFPAPPGEPPAQPARVLYAMAWLDKQVSNIATEIAARTMGLPNLSGSIQQGLQGIPDVDTDVAGPQDSALVIWDTGSFDITDPAQTQGSPPAIPPLANVMASGVCDPHPNRVQIPAAVVQLAEFLKPGGRIRNTCGGVGNRCDSVEPDEISAGLGANCLPFVP